MNFTIEVMLDNTVILQTVFENYSLVDDDPISDIKVIEILEESDRPLSFIIDVSRRAITLDDVIYIANKDARGEEPLWHHPNLQEVIFVHKSDLVHLAVRGLKSMVFGNLDAKVFKSVDEALDYLRAKKGYQGAAPPA